MIKTWQIFVFSLIPLALVFTGVIIGSIHGVDSSEEVFPTPAAPPASSGAPGGPSDGPPGAQVLQVGAQNLAFSPRSLSAPPNTRVTVRINNQDAGVLHNFAVYTNNQATSRIFIGEFHTGPGIKDYSFETPAAGNYFFRCDTHPDTMTGSFVVR